MTSETGVTKRLGDPEENHPNDERQQPSSQAPDLTGSNSIQGNNDDSPQSSSTASQSSPTKRNGSENSPTKGKNRRKNEARRRSANLKKQQQQGTANNEQSERPSDPSELKSPTLSTPQQPTQNQENQQPQPKEHTNHSSTHTHFSSERQPQSKEQKTQQSESISGQGNIKNSNAIITNNSRHKQTSELSREKVREYNGLKDQLKLQNAQMVTLVEQVKQQMNKIKELDTALLSTTRTCNQLEKLLHQELSSRTKLEAENESLTQTVSRLKTQLSALEKSKFNNDELVKLLHATLMERETEISLLKLKMTRMQTNPPSTMALNSASSYSSVKNDPCQVYASTGRSNSEFDRDSYIRSSMIAEAASVRASTTQLKATDRDASVWATVPEELTPSKRPLMLERSFQPIYGDSHFSPYSDIHSLTGSHISTPISRDRRYKTLPRSMKSPSQEFSNKQAPEPSSAEGPNIDNEATNSSFKQPSLCQITNLDDTNSTSQSSGNKTSNYSNNETANTSKQQTHHQDLGLPRRNNDANSSSKSQENFVHANSVNKQSPIPIESSHYSTIGRTNISSKTDVDKAVNSSKVDEKPPDLPMRTQTTPVKFGLKRIFDKFRRSDSTASSQSRTDMDNPTPVTPTTSPFKRGANRTTMVGKPNDIRAQMSPIRQAINFQTDKPFAEWDTDMLVDWLTMIGLSMYSNQCRRWVKCGAHIMNATPAEVDKGLGITNHLHRKKLRLAISELNGDCDKITKAAAKLDYLWVARWLDDVGLPQYKDAFINARVDGRVLNYLTVEDLVSMGVKSKLHHASIRCGIKVLRSINFDLQLLKRRATAEEVEQMSSMRQRMSQLADNSISSPCKQAKEGDMGSGADLPLWTCHRVMEWLRLIDFAEFASNLRGSGVHGGLIVFEDGFNIDTMCSLLSIPIDRTLLRRHLSTFFKDLVGQELAQKKRQYQDLSSNQQLNPLAEIKTPKKSQLWLTKLKSSKVGQDGMDEYLCPMYPVEPQIVKNQGRKNESCSVREESHLSKIPESIDV